MIPPPRVSIVMPTLNQRAFIASAVASVFAQDVADLELLVADGGSTDGTQRELIALCAAHPGCMRWRSVPDDGPADAVNRAVSRSHGSLIGWLNSDDLYAPGAVARAMAHFDRHPDHVMVYGEGEHIDAAGGVTGRYPSAAPSLPLHDWARGCPVCQPTAFMRREAFERLGGLDTSLRTAFDYEFWLRLWQAHPGRVGFVPALQAQSRVHAGALTQRLREAVALEGMEVVHRHLGGAPAHWLLTHFDEVMAGLPFDGSPQAPLPRLLGLLERARRWLSAADGVALHAHLAGHRALQFATPALFVPVDPDGWAPPVLPLRLRQPDPPGRQLRLRGLHAAPHGGPLQLEIRHADGTVLPVVVPGNGPFELNLAIAAPNAGAHWRSEVHCLNPFVPSQLNPQSVDRRSLAFMVEGVELIR